MTDIATALGVSKNAVSLALRNDAQIPASTRQRIQEAARKMGYERNPALGRVMSMMRKRGAGGALGTLAVFNANQDRDALRTHPTVPSYLRGARERSEALGYAMDSFWMHEGGMSGERWLEILQSRGVLGVLFIGLMRTNRLPDFIRPVIDAFPCVVTGVRTREPELSFASVDHHILALRAYEKALELGYKRPGLVLDGEIDELVDFRFSAGYRAGQSRVEPCCRLEPFTDLRSARERPELFREWLEKGRPDLVFTLYNVVRRWVEQMGVRVPEEVALAQLEWRDSRPEWAGMNQHNDLVGAVAVDMLLGMIHNGEKGVPQVPRATLIGPTWMNGRTIRTRHHQ